MSKQGRDRGRAKRDRQIGIMIEKEGVVDVARHRVEWRMEEGIAGES